MILTKRCDQKYNIRSGKTVKVATLDYYRKTEIKQIRDEGEGKLSFHITVDKPTRIENRVWNALLQGGIVFGEETEGDIITSGDTIITSSGVSVKHTGHTHSIINKAEVFIESTSLDGLIFCMSQAKTTSDCIDLFPEYNDQWHMNAASAHSITNEIGTSLLNYIHDPENKPITNSAADRKEIGVYAQHGPVIYMPRHLIASDFSNFDLTGLLNKIKSISFIKPAEFSREKEYRFLFQLVHNNQTLDVKKPEVILPASNKLIQESF